MLTYEWKVESPISSLRGLAVILRTLHRNYVTGISDASTGRCFVEGSGLQRREAGDGIPILIMVSILFLFSSAQLS